MLRVRIDSFSYTDAKILQNIHFQLNKGEHLAVLGESGCGKSTLLHLIYGLLDLTEGTLFWENRQLLGPKHNLVPGEDFMKLVAQEFNIMPYTTVAENIATYLPRLNTKKDKERIEELLDVVDLNAFAHIKVKDLSGGQKQRVALAKALAKEPELLLLDEPFSHIDTFRKNKLRRTLYKYLKERNIACITATHDAEEALAFSDLMLILNQGKIEKLGRPAAVFSHLETQYQASFFGDVSFIPSGVIDAKTHYLLPHQLKITEIATPLNVTVVRSYFKGSHYLIEATLGSHPVFFNHSKALSSGYSYFLTFSF
ncbi:MAG TPA: ATP-binding cassette domain-containing protein [Flavobacteriaceae bacterium]|nr:ATP-binding cassette domain-containing protein [Flavobacteriaceae bacterium]MCB9211982.1 ATP-binding cassette domain-containing protein [Alteromonas sp.]HPF09924.1 ATP-binding cassette domain-containing protein [Flavobacteriaceae bacterium]HQU20021.1 ATP-binding cassette domain-containing protein [Flavobacteriaceae bacterium]HQU63993.1 ATP-binding cassette domain-containing protein [Flavobacteriaceae bacterium]